MLVPNAEELRALHLYYTLFHPSMGYVDRDKHKLSRGSLEEPHLQENIKILRSLDKKGISSARVQKLCQLAKKNGLTIKWISDVVPQTELAKTEEQAFNTNLIQEGTVYFHPLLRIVEVPISKLEYGKESVTTGSITWKYINTFTLGMLTGYFMESLGLTKYGGKRKAFLGGMRYLLTIYSLDTILFAIDEAVKRRADAEDYTVIRDPLKLADTLLPEAEAYIEYLQSRRSENV